MSRSVDRVAQQRWRTTGVDLSDVAVRQANEHALQLGVRLNGVVDSLDHS